MDTDCDVIVVGAGPAGAALAAFLARTGWQVMLVDGAAFPRPKICGECLSVSAMPVLSALNVEAQIRGTAVVQQGLRIVLPRGTVLDLSFSDDPREGVLGISRSRLDWLLLQQARASGADVLLEHRVRDVLIEDNRVIGVELVDGREPAQPVRCLRARRLVIAADGRFSTIVRKTGKVAARGPRQVGFKRHRHTEGSSLEQPADQISMISLRGGYVGACNVEGQDQNICGLIPREAVRQSRGSLDAALAHMLRGYDRNLCSIPADSESPWITMPDVRQQWSVPQFDGVLYIGDALATIEPLAGQGLAMALRGADLAAEMLLSNGAARIDADWQQRYALAWRSRFGQTVDRARRLGWLLRRPDLIYPLAKMAPLSKRLEDVLMRATYRATRLNACQ